MLNRAINDPKRWGWLIHDEKDADGKDVVSLQELISFMGMSPQKQLYHSRLFDMDDLYLYEKLPERPKKKKKQRKEGLFSQAFLNKWYKMTQGDEDEEEVVVSASSGSGSGSGMSGFSGFGSGAGRKPSGPPIGGSGSSGSGSGSSGSGSGSGFSGFGSGAGRKPSGPPIGGGKGGKSKGGKSKKGGKGTGGSTGGKGTGGSTGGKLPLGLGTPTKPTPSGSGDLTIPSDFMKDITGTPATDWSKLMPSK